MHVSSAGGVPIGYAVSAICMVVKHAGKVDVGFDPSLDVSFLDSFQT